MPSQGQKNVSKCTLCFIIVSIMITTAAAIVLLVLLISEGNIGFVGSGSITLGACTNLYYSTKYANLSLINSVVFVGACVVTFTSTLLLFVIIGWTYQICKNKKPSNSSKGGLFILISINIIGSIPPLGYYLSYLLQINQCSSSIMDITRTLTIFLLAAAVLIVSLILLLIILCLQSKSEYDQVNLSQTQPNQQITKQEQLLKQQNHPVLKVKEDYIPQKLIQRKQNVYDSPSKRKISEDIQLKQKRPQRKYQPSRNYLNPKQNVIQNLHPHFKKMVPIFQEQVNKSNKYQRDNEERFRQYDKSHRDNDRRGILSRIQPQDSRQDQPRYNSRSPYRNNKRQQQPSDRYQRQPYRDWRQPYRHWRQPDRDWRQPDRERNRRDPYQDRGRDYYRGGRERDKFGNQHQYDRRGDNRNRDGLMAKYFRYRN